MNRFFCCFPGLIPNKPGPVFSVFSYVMIIIAASACNFTTKDKQVNTGHLPVKILLTPPAPISAAESERLRVACEAWYDSMLKSRGFQGGIVVAKKGNIIFEAYNDGRQPAGADAITDSTPVHIASVSKTFTAMSVLKLWQDGKCNLDDEYSKYFPAFAYPGVTIRTMLNHRSGLPNYVHFMENMGWDKKVDITNEDVLDFLITRKAEIENIGSPNRGFVYCNTNYALLALLVEKLSGKKYSDYLRETFFSPLQMNHTYVYNSKDSSKLVLSYDRSGRPIQLNFLDKVYGDKNIFSTPRDLLTWDRALTSGMLFTEKTLAEAYTPYSNERPGIRNYGLGWRMNNYPSGKKMIYHNGWWHGNNAVFIRLLQDSATIVVLGNKENHGIYHAKDLANYFGNYFGDGWEEEPEPVKPAKTILKKQQRAARSPAVAIRSKKSPKKLVAVTTPAKKKTQLITKRKPRKHTVN